MTGRSTKTLANEAWRELFDFIVGTVDHRSRVLQELGLTPNDGRALTSLEAKHGRTMRSLADEWRCDPSTATWIVDRLVRRGLVLRRADPLDRRITLVVLAAKGLRTRKQLLAGIYEAPPELLTLDNRELSALRDALAKLPLMPAPSGVTHTTDPTGTELHLRRFRPPPEEDRRRNGNEAISTTASPPSRS